MLANPASGFRLLNQSLFGSVQTTVPIAALAGVLAAWAVALFALAGVLAAWAVALFALARGIFAAKRF